ncbi:ubiquitin-like protein, putative [Bodo saltans]|uniref:Ubiquitin-like protein, putative n=1 Tax=Bodo saltans TaxID=75058 RepID=A0A0S4IJ22_BODSA|nr:ubiquitin-like protein, putative [Bodo saltans]|eukprot:CUE74232.1 ubiquitin-like protein, putative [Bodo saltans]
MFASTYCKTEREEFARHNNKMMANRSTTSIAADADPHRSTIRVRNIRESVVYHLMFDGDIGRLTGALLKQHIQSICGIPTDQQILTFNNFNVTNETTGFDLGLHDGCTLLLDTIARTTRRNSAAAEDAFGTVRGSSTEPSSTQQPASSGPVGRPAVLPPSKSRFEREMESLRRDDPRSASVQRNAAAAGGGYGYTNNGGASQHVAGLNASSSIFLPTTTNHGLAGYPASGLYDDVDVDVEITEESGVPLWQPTNSIDVEENRLLQQDYIWKMEQVRLDGASSV